MTQSTALDTEIADIDTQIAKLTARRSVLAEIRVEKYGPFSDGKTYPVVETVAEPVVAKASTGVKKLTKRPPSMAKLALTCLRKVGERGARRDAIRTFAVMTRGDVNYSSFSAVLQTLKGRGKITLVEGRYYIKGKAPAVTEA